MAKAIDYNRGFSDGMRYGLSHSRDDSMLKFKQMVVMVEKYTSLLDSDPEPYDWGFINGLKEALSLNRLRGKINKAYSRIKRKWR